MENGASGYILKNSSKEELIKAIHTVHEGGCILVAKRAGFSGISKILQNRTAGIDTKGKRNTGTDCRRIYQSADCRKNIFKSVYSGQSSEKFTGKTECKKYCQPDKAGS